MSSATSPTSRKAGDSMRRRALIGVDMNVGLFVPDVAFPSLITSSGYATRLRSFARRVRRPTRRAHEDPSGQSGVARDQHPRRCGRVIGLAWVMRRWRTDQERVSRQQVGLDAKATSNPTCRAVINE
jgi:hypothetical protein